MPPAENSLWEMGVMEFEDYPKMQSTEINSLVPFPHTACKCLAPLAKSLMQNIQR